MQTYPLALAVLGVAIVAAAVLPMVLARVPMSMPIVYMAAGMLLFRSPSTSRRRNRLIEPTRAGRSGSASWS